MKIQRALGIALFSAMALPAFAADLPTRRAPPVYVPPPIPLFSWTGFYAGGQVGAAFGRDRGVLDTTGVPAFVGGEGGPVGRFPFGTTSTGVIGGGHLGYNLMLPGIAGGFGTGLVVGIEGDIEGTDYRSAITSPSLGFFAIPSVTNRVRQEIAGSVRGRFGIAVDRALFYAMGGVAFTQFHSSYSVDGANLGLGGASLVLGDYTHSRIGYTVGGGIEYAVNTQFLLRAEYRYTNYGSFTDNVGAGLVNGFGGVPVTHTETQHRVQVGFSYKFDSPTAPVVARY